MATNLNLDQALLAQAFRLSGRKTKREAVNAALAEFVARRQQRRIIEIFGSLEWDPRVDYKKERDRG